MTTYTITSDDRELVLEPFETGRGWVLVIVSVDPLPPPDRAPPVRAGQRMSLLADSQGDLDRIARQAYGGLNLRVSGK